MCTWSARRLLDLWLWGMVCHLSAESTFHLNFRAQILIVKMGCLFRHIHMYGPYRMEHPTSIALRQPLDLSFLAVATRQSFALS
jgi:hypothetical protein